MINQTGLYDARRLGESVARSLIPGTHYRSAIEAADECGYDALDVGLHDPERVAFIAAYTAVVNRRYPRGVPCDARRCVMAEC